jgi:hypothetical protein
MSSGEQADRSELLAASSQGASEQAFRDLFGSARSMQCQRMKATALHRNGHKFPIKFSLFPTRRGEANRIGVLATRCEATGRNRGRS